MATAACTANAVRASASPRVNGSPSSRSYRLNTPRTRPRAATGTLTWVVAVAGELAQVPADQPGQHRAEQGGDQADDHRQDHDDDELQRESGS